MTKNLCIIQLNRFGDLIHTLQACKELKLQDKSLHLTLVGRKKFIGPLAFLLSEVFDEIYGFQTEDFFNASDGSLEQARLNLDSFLSEVNHLPFDEVVNLSFCKTSSLLTSLLSAPQMKGLARNRKSQLVVYDRWSQFLYATTMRGPYNPFHLVDIFKNILGVKRENNFWFSHLQKNPNEAKLVFFPFTSHKRKQWGLNQWIELCSLVLEMHPLISITILGSDQDQTEAVHFDSSEVLDKHQTRIRNLVGKTSLAETFEEISSAQLCVGHDSLGVQLAAVAQTPSLVLPLGTVRPQESSPYAPKTLVLAPKIKCFPCTLSTPCELFPCHQSISPRIVAEAISWQWRALESKEAPMPPESLLSGHFTCLEGELKDGLFHLAALPGTQWEAKTIYLEMYHLLWRFLLTDSEEEGEMPTIAPPARKELKLVHSMLETLYEATQFASKFNQQLEQQANKNKPSAEQIRDSAAKLLEVERMNEKIRAHAPPLGPLIDYFYVKKANTEGGNLKQLSRQTSEIIFEQAQAIRIAYELLDSILDSSAPSDTRGKHTA